MRRCSTNAKARVAQLNGFSPITAAAELSVAFGDCFYRWKARLLGGRGSSSAQGIGGRVRAPAPTQMQELFPPICRGRSQTGPRAATWGRPYEIRGTLRPFRRGRRPRRPAGAHCAPLRRKTAPGSPGTLVRKRQAQKRNRTNSNFPQTQGPVARREFRASLRFCAPELFSPLQGVTPVKWGPG